VPKRQTNAWALAPEASRFLTARTNDVHPNARRPIFLALLLSLAIVPLVAVNLHAYSDQAKQIGMHLKCMCRGCDMSAGGCSHPGGAFSGPCETAKGMLNEVDARLAKGETQEQIIQDFVNQYGAIVYVEPPKHGFGMVAWVMPFFYVILGIALVVFVIKKWLRPRPIVPSASGAAAISNESLDRLRAQASRETED
jgi:cytochrome c-type biogenesis protein CcmH/NrfF